MFMKQYNYKPRSNSQSSQGAAAGTAAAGSPPKDDKSSSIASQAAGAMSGGGTQASAGRRRSSASDKFAGLSAYKRSSEDHGDRKAAIADQKPGGQGILGGMWTSFTKGS